MNVVLPLISAILVFYAFFSMVYSLNPKTTRIRERVMHAIFGVGSAVLVVVLWGVF